MPIVAEHLRADVKTHHDNRTWNQVEHDWTFDLLLSMSALIEEDGSGYGELARRREIDHTFTCDYPLPNGEEPIKKGDCIRMWREGIGMPAPGRKQ